MDFAALNNQLNNTINRWYAATREYFLALNQNELYGWVGEGVGFILLVLGLILL